MPVTKSIERRKKQMSEKCDKVLAMQLTKDLLVAYLSNCSNVSCKDDGKAIAEMFKDIYQSLVKLQESEG
nr:MAG TPA: hypothetical protein [Caudoviricetes sp.]